MKPVVVFSHGFGVRKDDRGLFTDIAEFFGSAIIPIMFDYNQVDESGKILTVQPFSRQVEIFSRHIELVKKTYPGAPVSVIAHSQGCIVVAMASPDAQKVILLAPSPSLDMERLIKNFADRPGTVINLEGESKLTRRDGSMTLIGADYVNELRAADPIVLYNYLARHTKLIIIHAEEDEVLGPISYDDINPAQKIGIKANHDFSGHSRQKLLLVLQKEIG